jgi:hypothetical protein
MALRSCFTKTDDVASFRHLVRINPNDYGIFYTMLPRQR